MIDFDFSADLEKVVHATLHEAGIFGRDKARNTTLFKNNGPLRAATNFFETSKNSGFVIADKSYAVFLEEGNPYAGFQILPKNAKMLHFFINGEEVFAKASTAHGPLPFMQEAQDATEMEIEKIFDRNFERIIK